MRNGQNLLLETNQIQKDAVVDGKTELEDNKIANLKRRYSIILGKARRKYSVSGAIPGQNKRATPLHCLSG